MKFLSPKAVGILAGITGVLLFSSKAVMVKLVYQYEIETITALVLRMGFALPFYIGIALWQSRQKPALARRDWGYLFFFGLIGYYLASYFDFAGLQYIKASLERLILFIYPTLVLLLSWLFLKKRITRAQAIAVAVTYLGTAIVFSAELSVSPSDQVLRGGFLIFLSALTYAGYLVGSGWLIPRFGATRFTSYAMVISCAAVVVHYSLTNPVSALLTLPLPVYGLGLLMAVFATVIPTFLISYAIQRLGAGPFSILASFGPVSTISLAVIFLGETLTGLQLLGAAVVIAGIVVGERR